MRMSNQYCTFADMKAGVVVFPGSNCDRDMVRVLEKFIPGRVEILWHKDQDLKGVDLVVLPGGFSYGDYLRSGAIARYSPIMQEVVQFAHKGGLVMGICNGFQILCESGLLPGALLRNENRLFQCKNVVLKAERNDHPLTKNIPTDMSVMIPIAHGEGRYYADENTIKELESHNQVLFRYAEPVGNPNGSINDIAGICNKEGNVFGMMPHPERAADEDLHATDGLLLMKGLFEEALA